MEKMLEIKGLSKKFKGFSLQDINVSLDRGFIMGFIGPNGAGKSTTIKLMLNLLKKDGGEIKIMGLDHEKDALEIKNRIGFVLDEHHFYEELTLLEMKRIIAPLYEKWDDAQFDHYLKRFQLPRKQKIKTLSKGMKMKFALSLALSHHAEFLIMDEPTSGLDPVVRSELLDILTDLMQNERMGIFFSTHITSDLDKIADYIVFLQDGQIILNTTKDELLEGYGLVKGPRELLEELDQDTFVSIKESPFGFEGLTTDKSKLRTINHRQLIIEKPCLEDIMVYYTRRA